MHVVLSAGMARRLRRLGVASGAIRVLSNAAFLSASASQRPQRHLRTLGFLGNVCEEKGVLEFISLASELQVSHPSLRFILAGPFQDAETERKVTKLIMFSRNIRYVGAKYGGDKEEFFSEIDVLIFPTKYANEAEPVTLHEAMRSSVPVIAYGRGAIPEMIVGCEGLVISPSDGFVAPAKRQITTWIDDPDLFTHASACARMRFSEMSGTGYASLQSLISELLRSGDMKAACA